MHMCLSTSPAESYSGLHRFAVAGGQTHNEDGLLVARQIELALAAGFRGDRRDVLAG